MTLNLIPLVKAKYPGRRIHYACSGAIGCGLESLMKQAGIDLVLDSGGDWHCDRHERVLDLVGYPLAESYPHAPMRKHLIWYFAAELGLDLAEKDLPALELPRPERFEDLPERYATLQVKTGWSAYKEWPLDRWAAVVKELAD